MPIKTPAYFGAMSIWFTLNPPRENPNAPSVRVVAATPQSALVAIGMSIKDPADNIMPGAGV